tara:strand:+ start:153 stop:344 length:192 start_codon:yes stop_codon:yes gene_type:complete
MVTNFYALAFSFAILKGGKNFLTISIFWYKYKLLDNLKCGTKFSAFGNFPALACFPAYFAREK